MAGLDVADDTEEGDLNALVTRHGVVLKDAFEWGKRDTGETTRFTATTLQPHLPITIQYDCIGVGAGVKAEANRLKADGKLLNGMDWAPWNAGAGVLHPERRVIPGDSQSPKNEDFFANLKAQGWWELRLRFERTWRAINDPTYTWTQDQLISLPSTLPLLAQIRKELSQPTRSQTTGTLKMVVDKKPEGTRSPNLGDAIMMCYFPVQTGMRMQVSRQAVRQSAAVGGRRR
jgi:phage terminase large subunit